MSVHEAAKSGLFNWWPLARGPDQAACQGHLNSPQGIQEWKKKNLYIYT